MKDIILIFVVILVLLMLVSILGGSVQPKDMFFSSSPSRSPMARASPPSRSPNAARPMPSLPPSAHEKDPVHHMHEIHHGYPHYDHHHPHHHEHHEHFMEDADYSYQPVEYEVVDNEAEEEPKMVEGNTLTEMIETHTAEMNAVTMEQFTQDMDQHNDHYPDQQSQDQVEPQTYGQIEQFSNCSGAVVKEKWQDGHDIHEGHGKEHWQDGHDGHEGHGVEPFEGSMFAAYGTI